jgi:hypothetical protein
MARFPVCPSCRRNTPPLGATICRACAEEDDIRARADGVWERFFMAVEEAAHRLGESSLSEAARDMRHARKLVTEEKEG